MHVFYVDYTEENVKKYNNRLNKDFGNVEICYNTEPNQPMLVSMERIRNDPERYY